MSNKRGLGLGAGAADCGGGTQRWGFFWEGGVDLRRPRGKTFVGAERKSNGKYGRANLPSIWASLAFSALAVANQALKAAFSPPFSSPM